MLQLSKAPMEEKYENVSGYDKNPERAINTREYSPDQKIPN